MDGRHDGRAVGRTDGGKLLSARQRIIKRSKVDFVDVT